MVRFHDKSSFRVAVFYFCVLCILGTCVQIARIRFARVCAISCKNTFIRCARNNTFLDTDIKKHCPGKTFRRNSGS